MRILTTPSYRRVFAAITVAVGLTLAGAAYAAPALAAGATITGVVEDTTSTPQAEVVVNVLDPATDAVVTGTTTGQDGSFSVSLSPGTYNVQFIPPTTTGLQSYLATGVSTDSTPLTIILKTATVVQVQGGLTDSEGNVYAGTQGLVNITFRSPLNPGNTISTDGSGNYSTTLFADQNVTVSTFVLAAGGATTMMFNNLPVGTLDHSQTYDITMPTAQLSVSVQDASGKPVTGGKLEFGNSSVSPVPGFPGTSASTASNNGAVLDANGNLAIPVPDGITLNNPRIILSNGLAIPFTAPVMNGDQSVTVTVPASIQVQGGLTDSEGNVYAGTQGLVNITFRSPLNPGNTISTDGSGNYSTTLFADQNVTVSTFVLAAGGATTMMFNNLPVGTLDHSQTYDITMPTAQLSVSVQDASGKPVTGGKLEFGNSSVSPVPGFPGTSASTASNNGAVLDANGNLAIPVPDGITLNNPRIILSNGLAIPFTAPVMNGDQSVTVTVPASIQVQGGLTDSEGNVYAGTQGLVNITFRSPLNPGNTISTDGSGNYSTTLFADQNVTVSTFVLAAGGATTMMFNNLPVGTLDHSQTYDITMPTAQLSVSVQDASGKPVTGGKLEFGNSSVSPVPGFPGTSASTASNNGAVLDANGNLAIPVPDGITLNNPRIILNNGLVIAFTLHPITGDRHAFIIFNETTGTVIVDDQPPVVTGSADRPPNANGWYDAPVTITWTSVDPAPSSGTPNTPSPTTVSDEGANQMVTSGKSCDPAGNCATGSVSGINLDMTPPSVTLSGATNGAVYTGGVAPTPACATSDTLSGVAADATLSVTNSGNNYTATCSGATDNAGNTAAPVSVMYQVLPVGWTTASLADSNGNPISGASVTFRSAIGAVTNATTGSDGTAGVALAPGTYSVTMTYATGYQTKTITVTADGPNAVSFATVAVTAQISDPDASELATASVSHAGNTGAPGAKTAVDGNGQVIFQVLPGTNSFTAYDANGYQTQTVTVAGPMTVSFATVAVTVQINDPSNSDLASASAAHAGNSGAYGPKTAVDGNGDVTFQVLPGTNSFTAYDANGFQTQTVTVTGPATVSFSTVAVTVTVIKNGNPLSTATVTHTGNTGVFGPKTPVDGNGQVTFQVLTGTNSFTAWDGSASQDETITVTDPTSTTISVP